MQTALDSRTARRQDTASGDQTGNTVAPRDESAQAGVPLFMQPKPTSQVIGEANLLEMRSDIDFIVAKLKEQVLASDEEQEIVDRVRAWADWDTSFASSGGTGTPFLDKFLSLLKQRTFSRSSARMLFGLAGDEWVNAYDCIFYELEDERLDKFRELVGRSRKEGTYDAETEQMGSVYGVVGKHVGFGAWGILKQMSLAVTGLADAVIWLEWRRQGRPGDPPQLSPAVAAQYDEAARAMAGAAASRDVSEKELLESFGTGDRQGKIVGILMVAGTGSAGKGVQLVAKAAQIAQGAQGVEAAATKIAARVAAIRKAKPDATWEDFIMDDEIRLEVGNGLAALIGIIGGLAGDSGAVAEFFKRFGLLIDAVTLVPLLQKAWMDYTSAELALDPEKRSHVLEEDIAVIVGTIAAMIGGKYDAKRAQEKAAAEAAGAKVPPPAAGVEAAGPSPEVVPTAYEPHPFEGTASGLEPMSPAPQPLELVGPALADAAPAAGVADQPVRLYDPNGRPIEVLGGATLEGAASSSPKFFDSSGRPGELAGGQFVPEGMISPNEYLGPTQLYDAAGNPVEVVGGYTGGESLAPAPEIQGGTREAPQLPPEAPIRSDVLEEFAAAGQWAESGEPVDTRAPELQPDVFEEQARAADIEAEQHLLHGDTAEPEVSTNEPRRGNEPPVPEARTTDLVPVDPEIQARQRGNVMDDVAGWQYPYREVPLENPAGADHPPLRLDGYDPVKGEIISRKSGADGQLAQAGVEPLQELATVYKPGRKVADVPSAGPLAGHEINGQLVLEVPPQQAPIPEHVLQYAAEKGIMIRDWHGKVYTPYPSVAALMR